jgi:uncharacterized coiled-coil protein SlyX
LSIAQQNDINELRARIEALEHVANEQQAVIESLLDRPAKTKRGTLKLKQANGQAN